MIQPCQSIIVSGGSKILHVDDDHSFSTLVGQFLERQNDRFEIHTETSAKRGLDRLDDERFDCIVSDYEMPETDGLEFFDAVREAGYELPFILFTKSGRDGLASEALSAGVTDYIERGDGTDRYAVLANRIETAVESYRARTELETLQRQVSTLVEQSPLAIVEWTNDGEITGINPRAEELFGYEESELVGESWEALLPDSRREIDCELVDELLADGGEHHSAAELATSDGDTLVCESHNHIVTDEAGNVVTALSQFDDLTECRETHRRLERVFDNLPGVVYRYHEGAEQPFELVGGSCEELTGYTVEELREDIDLPVELVHPDDREYVRTELLARDEYDAYELTYRIQRSDGETRRVWERGQTYETRQADRVHEGLLIDVRERKRERA